MALRALETIAEIDLLRFDQEPDRRLFICRNSGPAASARILLIARVRHCRAQIAPRAAATICLPACQQLLGSSRVVWYSGTLEQDRPVPMESQVFEVSLNGVCGARHLTWRVDVVYTQVPATLSLSRIEPACDGTQQ